MIEARKIKSFYETKKGFSFSKLLCQKISFLEKVKKDSRILFLGYPPEILLNGSNKNTICLIPEFANYAATLKSKCKEVYVAENDKKLPFADNFFDYVIVINSLERIDNQNLFVKEVWRIMVDGGEMVIFCPNSLSLWRFFSGLYKKCKKISAPRLSLLLSENAFFVKKISSCFFVTSVPFLEKAFSCLFPYFGGVLISFAEKRIFSPILKNSKVTVSSRYSQLEPTVNLKKTVVKTQD